MLLAGRTRGTVGADKNYDVRGFVGALRAGTHHVAAKRPYSAVDGRTTRHGGYAESQRRRKLVEQVFGWMKTVGQLRSCATAARSASTGRSPCRGALQPGALADAAGEGDLPPDPLRR
jgi:hypothetical protein